MVSQTPVRPWFTSIRAVACASVIVWHVALTVFPEGPGDSAIWSSAFLLLGVVAREAVLVFVILSGYLLGRHWKGGFGTFRTRKGNQIKTYFVRRCGRILPAYWAACLVVIAAMLWLGLDQESGSHWDTGLPFTWERAAMMLLLLTDVSGMVPLSHQLWAVPWEFHLYLLGPVVCLIARRRHIVVLSVLTCIALITLAPWVFAPYFVFAFPIAFWLGIKRQTMAETSTWRAAQLMVPVAVAGVLLSAVALLTGRLDESALNYFLLDSAVTPVLLVWLLVRDLAGTRPLSIRLLELRWIQWAGERSYSTYLIHAVAIELVWRQLLDRFDVQAGWGAYVSLLTVSVIVTGVAAEVLYRTVERPTERISRQYGQGHVAKKPVKGAV